MRRVVQQYCVQVMGASGHTGLYGRAVTLCPLWEGVRALQNVVVTYAVYDNRDVQAELLGWFGLSSGLVAKRLIQRLGQLVGYQRGGGFVADEEIAARLLGAPV